MITDKYKVILIEINENPALYFINKELHNKNSKDYFNWVFKEAIIPCFYKNLEILNNVKLFKDKYYIIKDEYNLGNTFIYIPEKYNNLSFFYMILLKILFFGKNMEEINILEMDSYNDFFKVACILLNINYSNMNINKNYDLIYLKNDKILNNNCLYISHNEITTDKLELNNIITKKDNILDNDNYYIYSKK